MEDGLVGPDPSAASTPAEFVATLNRLHSWAGKPSLRRLRECGGTRTSSDGQQIDALPPATVSNILRGKRRTILPRLDFVVAFVRACLAAGEISGPDPVVRRWTTAWRALASDGPASTDGSSPTGTATSGNATEFVRPRQLPAVVPRLTGRARELKRLDEAAGEDRPSCVVISGTAGVGKTTLALAWARAAADRFPDGQIFVDLRGFDPASPPVKAAEAIRRVLESLGLGGTDLPTGLDELAARYRSVLAGRRVLLVLDDARDVAQVRPLLPGGPEAYAVVTSRDRLTGLVATEGARTVGLGLLDAGEAEELLKSRLGVARVMAEPDAAAALVDRCARLPLALAVAAACAVQEPELGLSDLVDTLTGTRERLDALDGGEPATDLRAVFQSSYDAQSPEAQRLFRLLGEHPGTAWSEASAASRAGVPVSRTRRLLRALVDAHLVVDQGGGRFAFHDLLRSYAIELANEIDTEADRSVAFERVLAHYLHTGRSAASAMHPTRTLPDLDPMPREVALEDLAGSAGEAGDWFARELPALLSLVESASGAGRHHDVVRLSWIVADFLTWRGRWADLIAVHREALHSAQQAGDRAAEAHTHRRLAHILGRCGSYDEAWVHVQRALVLAEELGDRAALIQIHRILAWVWSNQGRYAEALEEAERAYELSREAGNRLDQGRALNLMGFYHLQLGEPGRALVPAGLALELQREIDDRVGRMITLDTVGAAYHRVGRHREAATVLEECVAVCREVGDRNNEATALHNLGDARDALGDREEALVTWQQALAIMDEVRHRQAPDVRAKLRTRIA